MAKRPKTDEQRTELVAAIVPLTIREVIEDFAEKEDRSMSYIAWRLLEESPRVQKKLKEMASAA